MAACVACSHTPLEPVVDLGTTPLANALLDTPNPAKESRFPLRVARCPECSLVQIMDRVPPEEMFSDYVYFSSYSAGMLQHAEQLASELAGARKLDASSLVVEIASNDGYLLQFYAEKNIPVLGVEPAANIAKVAVAKGIPTHCAFFTRELGKQLAGEGKRADVMHAHNVFAHVPDPCGFLGGIYSVLKPNGIAVIEAPYVKDLLDKVEFDTVYHEHVSYVSLTAIDKMAQRENLQISDVRRTPIHGGSLQVHLSHKGNPVSPRVSALLAEEKAWGVNDRRSYDNFSRKVSTLKTELLALLQKLKSEGKTIAAYGASAKGATLLNFCGIDGQYIDFVVDRSPHKVGKFTPGTHLAIRPTEELAQRKPDYALLLAWNFADEILEQQKAYSETGGRFILPVPSPRVIET